MNHRENDKFNRSISNNAKKELHKNEYQSDG